MFTCECSWTLITQEGEDDAVMHAKIHMVDAHHGEGSTEEEIRRRVRKV
jgi:hypothetical protein